VGRQAFTMRGEIRAQRPHRLRESVFCTGYRSVVTGRDGIRQSNERRRLSVLEHFDSDRTRNESTSPVSHEADSRDRSNIGRYLIAREYLSLREEEDAVSGPRHA
jgi:hypothetical protein